MKFVEADFKSVEAFTLESGVILPKIVQHYAIFGKINSGKSNVTLIFYALTGSARIDEWGTEISGDGKALDTSENAFVCINFLGSREGSTGANFVDLLGKNNKTEFPLLVTVADIIRAQKSVLDFLGIEKLNAVIGGSLGGMCALQFASEFPGAAEKCVAVGACELSATGLALNHLQREALKYEKGVSLARQIAMISYKSRELFNRKFSRRPNRNGENPRSNFEHRFDIAGYLDYQGAIFTKRFDAETYCRRTKAMDLFELSDGQMRKIKAKTYLVGISSDWLFPASDVKNLAEKLKENGANAEFIEFVSLDGHDAFLSDTRRMSEILKRIFTTKTQRTQSFQ
ncbi:MAG: alpha/beta fold hydrolase [Pyrinomonadaceae bacterium]